MAHRNDWPLWVTLECRSCGKSQPMNNETKCCRCGMRFPYVTVSVPPEGVDARVEGEKDESR